MGRRILKINTGWTEDNFCCSLETPEINGVVVSTNKTLEGLKTEFANALRFHIEGCVADGDDIPQELVDGNYELEFVLDVPAILRDAEKFTTLTAISRVTGINKNQLSHYVSGEKKPRADKRKKIIEGIHRIGRMALSIH